MVFYFWIAVELIILGVNAYILNKHKYDIPYQKWYKWYFYLNKIMTAVPSVLLMWTGYIFLYSKVEIAAYNVFGSALGLFFIYCIPLLALAYINCDMRKIYAVIRAALTCINFYQIYFIYIHRNIILDYFDATVTRNIFFGGETQGCVLLAILAIIEVLNVISFIQYYRYNRYEMTV